MTPAIIISRYADPDINNRRRNVREGIALARWAAANGYCPVGWWDDLDTVDPPCDSDPAVRQAALERSATRARMVGAAGGVAIAPGWCDWTSGMERDYDAWDSGLDSAGKEAPVVRPTRAQIEPYLPRDLAGQVQQAVDEIHLCEDDLFPEPVARWRRWVLAITKAHTGITPTEVTP